MNQAVLADPHQNKIYEIEDKIALLENEKADLLAKLNWFEEHFRLNQHRLYGRSSEQTVHAEQQTLFNEAEALDAVTPTVQEPTLEEITYKRKKKQKGHRGGEMLKDLPVEIIEHKLPEEEPFRTISTITSFVCTPKGFFLVRVLCFSITSFLADTAYLSYHRLYIGKSANNGTDFTWTNLRQTNVT